MNSLFLILVFLAFPVLGFAELIESDFEGLRISAALVAISGLVACFYLTVFKPIFINLELGSSKDDFKSSGYEIPIPSPTPSVSSASSPIFSSENVNLFWCGLAFLVVFVAFYCMVAFLVRKDCLRKIIGANYQPPATEDNGEKFKLQQAAVAMLRRRLDIQRNQIEHLRCELSAAIDKNNALTRRNCQLGALIDNASGKQLQAPVESVTNTDNKSNNNENNACADSDSDNEMYHNRLILPINTISATNGGNMLGRVTLGKNSELNAASGSRTFARLNRAVSNSQIKRRASKIFHLSNHAGRGSK
ncbi:hypothetical protein COEREDRAFT_7308 [Coemansia reversa NRRL 1564]|uniref:BAP29/BAP31 transmembrane domain-containing protein n=1 Tax=Coemansia reversa (strain ATCC 12441 / NRRL 1564) TaxID=763665 RepID=A0A2G5BFB5_COERN|nr:hypothetical protein COEREDRAFT_7308 [Coemansia reversa NRRL 1564]|eukprot:PIA17716.1 hypothetical protein COEREDRAFT_7308 [Coemansia reversa NRRL 1564]